MKFFLIWHFKVKWIYFPNFRLLSGFYRFFTVEVLLMLVTDADKKSRATTNWLSKHIAKTLILSLTSRNCYSNIWLHIKPILFLKYRPHQTRSNQCNIFNSNNHIFCALTFHLVPINTFIPVKNAQIVFIRNISTKVAYQTIIKPDWLSLIDWTQPNGLIIVPSVFSRTYKNLARKATRIILPNTPISDDFSRADLIESFTKCTKCKCVGDLMTNSEWLIVKIAWSKILV